MGKACALRNSGFKTQARKDPWQTATAGEDELNARFNAAIAKIREDGTCDRITAGYLASSIQGS
ncbi:MAG: hypothetical protein B7Z10_06515 [Rhodobacterales bacterium 32-66-7]|nr:MAG: hypothetical protein B7Z31_10130 [Rhodobacterales bacterium 12-65-15]OYX25399.1 MAG: hypothetical protein B7Z10_06515 [Rhodobacterales bacterium 32-66-7]